MSTVPQRFQFVGIDALYGHNIDICLTPDSIKTNRLAFEPVVDYEQLLVIDTSHPFSFWIPYSDANPGSMRPKERSHHLLTQAARDRRTAKGLGRKRVVGRPSV